MSNYPVGARWVKNGSTGKATIWLESRNANHEVWKWSWIYPDGSGSKFDWGTSMWFVKDECPEVFDRNGKPIRFKRVKEPRCDSKQTR